MYSMAKDNRHHSTMNGKEKHRTIPVTANYLRAKNIASDMDRRKLRQEMKMRREKSVHNSQANKQTANFTLVTANPDTKVEKLLGAFPTFNKDGELPYGSAILGWDKPGGPAEQYMPPPPAMKATMSFEFNKTKSRSMDLASSSVSSAPNSSRRPGDADENYHKIKREIYSLPPSIFKPLRSPEPARPHSFSTTEKPIDKDRSCDNILNTDLCLSETSDDDTFSSRTASTSIKRSVNRTPLGSSSNSDSSSSEDDSSSSDCETVRTSPLPAASTPTHTLPTATSWCLEELFKPNQEAAKATNKNESQYDLGHSPLHNDPAPPVVTTEPASLRNGTIHSPSSHLKRKHSALKKSSPRRRDASSNSIFSDSDEEEKEAVKPPPQKVRRRGRPPKDPSQVSKPKPPKSVSKPKGKKPEPIKNYKSVEMLPSDIDSSDDDSVENKVIKKKMDNVKPKPVISSASPVTKSVVELNASLKNNIFSTNVPTGASGPPSFVCKVNVKKLDNVPPRTKGGSVNVNTKDIPQMRTSPPNNDQKKQRAISCIYKGSKARQTSQEPEKETPPAHKGKRSQRSTSPTPSGSHETHDTKRAAKSKRDESPSSRKQRKLTEHKETPVQNSSAGTSSARNCDAAVVPSNSTVQPVKDTSSVASEVSGGQPEIRYRSAYEPQHVSESDGSFLARAKELKHLADRETNRFLQIIMYLEAGLYFLVTADSMTRSETTSAFGMYGDTLQFIFHLSTILMHRDLMKSSDFVAKVYVLSSWCQSVICMKQYKMSLPEVVQLQNKLKQYNKIPAVRSLVQTVDEPNGENAPMAANSADWKALHRSPCSTPSPATSDVSHTSSGYSTETQKLNGQNPENRSVPSDFIPSMYRHISLTSYVNNSMSHWSDAVGVIEKYDVKNFFIDIDRKMGSLTPHSSAMDLLVYIRIALDSLKEDVKNL